jgi:hypothetical protein
MEMRKDHYNETYTDVFVVDNVYILNVLGCEAFGIGDNL